MMRLRVSYSAAASIVNPTGALPRRENVKAKEMKQMENQRTRRIIPISQSSTAGLDTMGVSIVVDIVFIIDGTGSMQNALDNVTSRALQMRPLVIKGLKGHSRNVTKMRVKVVVFRDLFVDANAYEESEFFTLPEEAEQFRDYVEQIKAQGGGDEPESALEALWRVMKYTEFQQSIGTQKARHVLVVMTDASGHRLDDPQREGDPLYPSDVPDKLSGIEAQWQRMNHDARRLIITAPNSWPWVEMSLWSNVNYHTTDQGKGISSEVMDNIIAYISGSF